MQMTFFGCLTLWCCCVIFNALLLCSIEKIRVKLISNTKSQQKILKEEIIYKKLWKAGKQERAQLF